MSFACSRISHKWNHILWFCWLLRKMFLRFTNVVACINDLFLLTIERHSIAWIQYITARSADLLVTDTWVDSMLELLWIKLLWSFLYMPVLNICFYNVSGVNIRNEIAGLDIDVGLELDFFQSACTILQSSMNNEWKFLYSTSLPKFVVVIPFNFSHTGGHILLFNCGFSLLLFYFLFCLLIGHLYVFFCGISV